MCKHVDLIAVTVLLLAFAFATHLSGKLHGGFNHVRFLQLRHVKPIVVTPYRTSSVRYEYRK